MRFCRAAVGLSLLALAACSESLAPSVVPRAPRRSPEVAARSPGAQPWEPLDVAIDRPPQAPPVPLTAAQIQGLAPLADAGDADAGDAGAPGLAPLSADAGPTTEGFDEELLRNGFVVAPPTPGATHMGAFYKDLRARGGAAILTLETLVEIAHLAIAEAIAEVDAKVLYPALVKLLASVDATLTAEAKGAASDLIAPYAMARGVVAVGRTLLDPAYAAPLDLAEPVAREIGCILAQKEADSPLLGVRVDYSNLSFRAGADLAVPTSKGAPSALAGGAAAGGISERLRVYRVLAWLQTAPLLLREDGGLADRVGLLRVHARATLLLAHAVRPDVSAEASRAWDRVESLARFFVGDPDEPTLRDVDRAARAAGIDLADGRAAVDVAKVDRVRHALARGTVPGARAPRLADGSRAVVRFFAPRYSPDAEALQRATRGHDAPHLPKADALVTWMRDAERTEEHHDALYLSMLDTIATMARPSAADVTLPAAAGAGYAERRAAVAKTAWATLRHDVLAPGVALLTRAPSPASTADAGGPCFVEPHPEAIAKLVASVRQAQRGLAQLNALPDGSPARAVLAHVDELLTAAFEVALLAANDEEATEDQRAVLRALPAWLDALEWATSSETPRVVDVHLDPESRRVLEVGTAGISELTMIVREPGTGRLVVASGAVLAPLETTARAEHRLGDAALRARLRTGAIPVR